MARKLPWANSGVDSNKTRPNQSPETPLHVPQATTGNSSQGRTRAIDAEVERTPSAWSASKARLRLDRSPSSSPPPSPPAIVLMREDGQDDKWIMVEDEFMSTANEYTRRLHHTAYKEREAEAARRNALKTRRMTRKHTAENKATRRAQDNGAEFDLDQIFFDDADDGGDLVISDRRLAGLMSDQSPRSQRRIRLDLVGPTKDMIYKTNDALNQIGPTDSVIPQQTISHWSRAGSETASCTSDDDLDAIVHAPQVSQAAYASPTPQVDHQPTNLTRKSNPDTPVSESPARKPDSGMGESFLTSTKKSTEEMSPPATVSIHTAPDLDDDGFPKRRITTSLAEWRSRRAKRVKQDKQDELVNREVLPLFLT